MEADSRPNNDALEGEVAVELRDGCNFSREKNVGGQNVLEHYRIDPDS